MSNQEYKQVFLRHKPEPVWCYRSGLTVYEERFLNGALISGGWNGAGYPLDVLTNYPSFLKPTTFAEPTTFHVELDGESVDYLLELQDQAQVELENGSLEQIVTLKSTVKPVVIRVHTLLDGTAVLTRWLEIENCSEADMALSRLSVFSGGLEGIRNFRHYAPDAFPEDIYELGYFQQDMWGKEGDLIWQPLNPDKTTFEGRFARQRYRHPAFFLRNKLTGTFFFGQIGWSAGYACSFDYMACHDSTEVSVGIDLAITGHKPLRLIAPGECYVSPMVHIGMLFGDLDDAVQAMHTHVRRSVLNLPEANGDAGLVGAGMGPEHDMSMETSKRFIDQLSELGAEIFIVDAGWYCPPNKETEWWKRAGDWHDDRDRYPNGILELRDYAHNKGMKFGMWMESERVGEGTACFAEHPDWFTKRTFGETTTGFLDFTNPEAAAWAEEEAARVISEYKLDLFRIDYNIGSAQYFYYKEGKRGEYGALKHYEAIYAMYERLKKRFPDVIFENCAGGGGRTDLAMLKAFNHSWVSDCQDAPRSLYITSGMTMVLPPERVDRLVSGMGCHGFGELALQMRNAMLGHISLNVLSPALAEFNPQQMAFIKHSVQVYKDFIRPFLPMSKMYHHIQDIPTQRKQGLQILELAAEDRSKAAITIFKLPEGNNAAVTVVPRGLDRAKQYRVTLDNSGMQTVVSGWELSSRGIVTEPMSPMTSELILLEAVAE